MRIVVVEDNELYRDELLQCLEQEESDIEIIGSAANGARGLALVEKLVREKAGPDVIFTDIRMPEMDGFEMIEALQKRKSVYLRHLFFGGNKLHYLPEAVHQRNGILHLYCYV